MQCKHNINFDMNTLASYTKSETYKQLNNLPSLLTTTTQENLNNLN